MVANGHREALRDQSVRELVKELSGQVSLLVHQEVELAKAEMNEKGKKAGVGAGMLGGAALAGLALVGSLTAFLILVIAIAILPLAALEPAGFAFAALFLFVPFVSAVALVAAKP